MGFKDFMVYSFCDSFDRFNYALKARALPPAGSILYEPHESRSDQLQSPHKALFSMKPTEQDNVDNEFKVLPRWMIYLLLWIGLMAGIAVRLLMLLNRVNPVAAIWVWRFAMLSYTVFFGYRYIITRRRRLVITHHSLLARISEAEDLDPTTRAATLYILRSITRSKELFNYAFICILSMVALILDFIVD
jgi:hypothetical protein